MRWLVGVDGWIIDAIFQPVLNRLPGSTIRGVARFLAMGMIVTYLGSATWQYLSHTLRIFDAVMAGIAVPLWLMLYAIMDLSLGRTRNGMRNYERVFLPAVLIRVLFVVRTITVWPLLLLGPFSATMITVPLFMVFVYVRACDEPPPPSARQTLWFARPAMGRG